MSFNQDSAIPEQLAGANPTQERVPAPEVNPEPSVEPTDPYGLASKPYLTRKYNVVVSKAGNPYFEPIESVVREVTQAAPDQLAEAMHRVEHASDEQREATDTLSESFGSAFEAVNAQYESEWVARKLIIWPLMDQVGNQLYRAAAADMDLQDYGAYLLRTKAVPDVESLPDHEQFAQRLEFVESALFEAGKWNTIVHNIETTDVNFAALIRAGFRAAAMFDTKQHLQGASARADRGAANDEIKSRIASLTKLAAA